MDKIFAYKKLKDISITDFQEEITAIRAVQAAVIAISPVRKMIAKGKSREPRDLYLSGHGICADRARTIEKILTYLGFRTRYASLYLNTDRSSSLEVLLTPAIPSHAVIEVHTTRGWMVVDTTSHWIGLRADGRPISLQSIPQDEASEWSALLAMPDPLLLKDLVVVYGLYSRHGYFYKPMTPFPDVNWRDFVWYNIQHLLVLLV
jgi:hypothetical protein